MKTPDRVSEEHEAQKRLVVATSLAVRSQWRGMGGDWTAAFGTVGPRMAAILSAGQLASARQGAAYVPEVLAEQGQYPRALGRVNARAFAGRAADGRDLTSLLEQSVVKSRVGGSLDAGGKWLDTVVQTELADAHRASIQVATVARQKTGYIRMVNTPCCKDCAVLAGKWFKSNAGFDRHPHCMCFHLPSTDPESEWAQYPEPSEITGLTDAERKALEEGGDYSQVINSGRGRSRSARRSKMSTLEGTTTKGWFGGGYSSAGAQRVVSSGPVTRRGAVVGRHSRRVGRRMTPDGIYRVASDEDEARRLLGRYGYLG